MSEIHLEWNVINLIYDLHRFLTLPPYTQMSINFSQGSRFGGALVCMGHHWVTNSLCKALYIYYPVDAWVLPTLNFTVHC